MNEWGVSKLLRDTVDKCHLPFFPIHVIFRNLSQLGVWFGQVSVLHAKTTAHGQCQITHLYACIYYILMTPGVQIYKLPTVAVKDHNDIVMISYHVSMIEMYNLTISWWHHNCVMSWLGILWRIMVQQNSRRSAFQQCQWQTARVQKGVMLQLEIRYTNEVWRM